MGKVIISVSAFLIISLCLFADSEETTVTMENTSYNIIHTIVWKEIFYAELNSKLLDTNITEAAVLLISNELKAEELSDNPVIAALEVFDLARKYDVKLRRGDCSDNIIGELRQEIALRKKEDNSNKLLIIFYTNDRYKEFVLKDKKDKKVKDKIKKDKDKNKDKDKDK
jgi:hypothetical protein